MKVLVTGGREWDNWSLIWKTLRELGPNTEIIHGKAPGADRMAGFVAKELGYQVREYPADWDKHGKAAGTIRNRVMFDTEKPDLVIAFKDDFEAVFKRWRARTLSCGTCHMVEYAKAHGCVVQIIDSTIESEAKDRKGSQGDYSRNDLPA